MDASASRAMLIAHRDPVRGLELELMARSVLPASMPIVTVSTPSEAYLTLQRHEIVAALLEENPDLIAFATHVASTQPELVVGWIQNGAPAAAAPPFGVRLNRAVVLADLRALAATLNTKGRD